MNKSEYIRLLGKELGSVHTEEHKEILADYDEHFRMGVLEGKSEEQIAEALGDPKVIAKQYKVDSLVREATETKSVRNITRAVIATIGLGFFNLIFILGPFLAIVGVMVGFFAASIGMVLGGVAGFVATLIRIPIIAQIHPLAALFFTTGVTAMGMLFFIGNLYIGRFLYNATLAYLRLNLSIIRK